MWAFLRETERVTLKKAEEIIPVQVWVSAEVKWLQRFGL